MLEIFEFAIGFYSEPSTVYYLMYIIWDFFSLISDFYYLRNSILPIHRFRHQINLRITAVFLVSMFYNKYKKT